MIERIEVRNKTTFLISASLIELNGVIAKKAVAIQNGSDNRLYELKIKYSLVKVFLEEAEDAIKYKDFNIDFQLILQGFWEQITKGVEAELHKVLVGNKQLTQ